MESTVLIPSGALIAVLGWAVSRLISQVDKTIEELRQASQSHETRISLLEAGVRKHGKGE